ncbi:MAG TPA: MCP four helix bundle domain-containing protein, partial [Rhizobacter sp.]|nr:MCP four helix bundle domain-containing protein [Rhizobacter sp.]
MTDLSIRARLALLIAVLLVLMGAAAGFALYQLRGVSLSVQTVYADRVLPLLQLRAVADAYLTTLPAVMQQVRDGHQDLATGLAELESSRREAREQWRRYKTTYLVPQEKVLVAEAEPLLARAEALQDKAIDLLGHGDPAAVRAFAVSELYPVVRPLNAVLDKLIDVQAAEAAAEAEASRGAYSAGIWGLLALVGLGLAVGVGLAWAVVMRYARERREGEEKALQQARFYAALSRTNQMIVRVRDAKTLFEEICRICVETQLARAAFTVMLDGEAITIAGMAGQAAPLVAGAPVKLHASGPLSKGPVMEALREGQRKVANDYQNQEQGSPWHGRIKALGLRAVGAFPIRR